MPSFPHWADLPSDLICRIGDSLDIKCYASARGTCAAWRCALAPASPSLLVVLNAALFSPYAASLPTHRSFDLKGIFSRARCVGSSNGWLALRVSLYNESHIIGHSVFSLFHPITATEIILPPLIYETRFISKLVFAPNPVDYDFAAVAICDIDRLAYVTAGARRWAILDRIRLTAGDQLTDLVYHEKDMVYCLTLCGDVHVLRLPERRRRKPAIFEDPEPDTYKSSTPERAGIGSNRRSLQQLMCSERRRWKQHHPTASTKAAFFADLFMPLSRMLPGSVGQDLNDPATIEPFDPATNFAPPYNTVSVFTSAKNLVFCDGNLYQIWRNASCTVTLQLPGGGHRRVAENEIMVLRYYPRRQPCWDAVTDLGGYSVFVGKNNAVSMCAEGVPRLKANCVYWIGGRGRDQGMVFDMETGRSTPCLPPAGIIPGPPNNTICWYFLSDIVNNCNNSGGRVLHQT